MQRYEEAFRANEIDAGVLPTLTSEDLKDLGVTLVGHRRRLLDAIAALDTGAPARQRPPDPDRWCRRAPTNPSWRGGPSCRRWPRSAVSQSAGHCGASWGTVSEATDEIDQYQDAGVQLLINSDSGTTPRPTSCSRRRSYRIFG